MKKLFKTSLILIITLLPIGLTAGSSKKRTKTSKKSSRIITKQTNKNDIEFLDALIKQRENHEKRAENKKKIIIKNIHKNAQSTLTPTGLTLFKKIMDSPDNIKNPSQITSELMFWEKNLKYLFTTAYSNFYEIQKENDIVGEIKEIANKYPEYGGFQIKKNVFHLNLPIKTHFTSMLRLYYPASIDAKQNFKIEQLIANKNFIKNIHYAKKAGLKDDYLEVCLALEKLVKTQEKSKLDEQKIGDFFEDSKIIGYTKLIEKKEKNHNKKLAKRYFVDEINQLADERNPWVADKTDNETINRNYETFLLEKLKNIQSLGSIIKLLKQLENSLEKISNKTKKVSLKKIQISKEDKPNTIKKNNTQPLETNEVNETKKEKKPKEENIYPDNKISYQSNILFYSERVARWFNNPQDALAESKKRYKTELTDQKAIAFHAFWQIVDNFIHFGFKTKNNTASCWSIPGRIVFKDKETIEGVFEYVYSKEAGNNLCIHRWFRPKKFIQNHLKREIINEALQTLQNCENFSSTETINNTMDIDDYKIMHAGNLYVDITRKNNTAEYSTIKSITLYNTAYMTK